MADTIRRGFSVKPSKDSKESKQVVLEVDTTGATPEMVLELALKDVIIREQQKLREPKAWKALKNGDIRRVNLVDYAPRGTRVDPMEILKAKTRRMTPEQREAFIKTGELPS